MTPEELTSRMETEEHLERILLVLFRLGEAATPLKRLQKAIYLTVAQGTDSAKMFSFVNYPFKELSIGPHSLTLTQYLNELCYRGYAMFSMEKSTDGGGPHGKYQLSAGGKNVAKKMWEKSESRVQDAVDAVLRYYQQTTVAELCDKATMIFLQGTKSARESHTEPVSVATTSIMYAPSKNENELLENAREVEEKLKLYGFHAKSEDAREVDSRKFVPISIKVDKDYFFKDLGSSNIYTNPDIERLLANSCTEDYLAYLYQDSGLLVYYAHPGFPVDGVADELAPLMTSTHFTNLCKRVATSINLTIFSLYNEKIASRFGSRSLSYVPQE